MHICLHRSIGYINFHPLFKELEILAGPDRLYENLRKNVRAAVSSGVQFQYHVGIEEHLAYARRLHALAIFGLCS